MHAGEGRHDRSRPYPSLGWRVLIGAYMGSYLGVLELWVYNSDLAGIFAVTTAPQASSTVMPPPPATDSSC